jgi:hypothetical protein
VIMPRVGDVGKLIGEAEVGWATEPTPESFAQGMIDALRDRAATHAAGVRARALAETELAWSRLVEHLLAFYQRLGSGPTMETATTSAGAST